jgi:hypothetical protein
MKDNKKSESKLFKSLKDEYPEYLREREVLNSDNLRILIPYALENKRLYIRKEIVQTLIALHEKVSGKKVTDQRSVVRALRNILADEANFSNSDDVFGGWTYLGPSALKGEKIAEFKRLKKTFHKPKNTSKYKVLKEIDAIDFGDETLYVWWHPETEELATIKKDKTWAMKIGMHTSRRADKRIEEYKTSIPYKPIIGLLVYCKKSRVLERTIHNNLTNRKRKIGEAGDEWFITNVSEIEEILKFNEII